MPKGIIYKATNIKNNKSYIGQTIRELKSRKKEHINNNSSTKFHKALQEYKEDFKWSILYSCNACLLNMMELYFIEEYDTFDNGYNSANKAVVKGYKLCEETKQKMSKGSKGKGNNMYGKRHSEETKQKMRDKKTNKTKYNFIHKSGKIEDNIIQNEMCFKYNLNRGNIYKLIKGKIKQFKGWKLKI